MAEQGSSYRQLLDLLNKGEELDFISIARRIGVGSKQARRLVDQGITEGYAICERRENRRKIFFIPHDRCRPGINVYLTQDELLALTVVADAARGNLGTTTLATPLLSGIEKLIAQFPEQLVPLDIDDTSLHWHFSSTPTAEVDPEIFRGLIGAIRDEKQIVVDYYSASRGASTPNRRLDPYALALRGSTWLLVAWCHDRRKFRDFSIPAITNLRVQNKSIFRKDSFDLNTHFQGRFGSMGGTQTWLVRIQVEHDRIPYFKRKRYHPSQRLHELPDGTAIVEYTVSGLEDIRSFAQSWGNGITVLEPPELVTVMRKQANELAERYNRGTFRT